ncbi:MAG: DUF4880 domain-containing protein [Comamonadaceae bacterium]|nr:MAG: DUF4880 domain-containing protein [Comamonadaceae bacterium]
MNMDAEAATWALRRREGLTAAQRAELQAWLDADARHAGALDGMAATFGHLRQVSAEDLLSLKMGIAADQKHSARKDAPDVAPPARTADFSAARRPWLPSLDALFPQAAVAVLAVMVVGGGWLGWDSWRRQPVFKQAYSTERGRQVVATLPDAPSSGTQVQLDTATRLDARLFRDRREVDLKDGQAMFTVHGDKNRPFHVQAGPLKITVVGTRFSVRHTATGLDAGQTVVSVEEGLVRVTAAGHAGENRDAAGTGAAETPIELTAGQMLVGDADGRLGPVTRLSPTAVAAWRNGRISFDHTPLAQALAEFERYGSTGLVVNDPAVASLRVGGSYSLQQMHRFAETLPQVLPVQLVQRGDVTEIVMKRP